LLEKNWEYRRKANYTKKPKLVSILITRIRGNVRTEDAKDSNRKKKTEHSLWHNMELTINKQFATGKQSDT
jgi:hypothetical protein